MKKILLAASLLLILLSCGNNKYGDRGANGDTIIILQVATDTLAVEDSTLNRTVVQSRK